MSSCAIITGGNGGIGKAIALKLAQDGYNIVITHISDLTNEVREQLVAEFHKLDRELLLVQANVINEDECQSVVQKAIEKFSDIDILVNNAGITKDNLLTRMSLADFNDVIDVNLVGTFNMIKAVQRKMIKQKYGRIVNISSVIGVIGNAGQANYAASKAGIIGLSKSLARELASRNITVNCVAPGFIETKMTAVLSDDVVEKIMQNIPLKRLGSVDDVANAVSFLCSKQSLYITGQVLNVCGGMVI